MMLTLMMITPIMTNRLIMEGANLTPDFNNTEEIQYTSENNSTQGEEDFSRFIESY